MIYRWINGKPVFAISTFAVDGKNIVAWTAADVTRLMAQYPSATVTPLEQPSAGLTSALAGQTFANFTALDTYIKAYQAGTNAPTFEDLKNAVTLLTAAVLGGND